MKTVSYYLAIALLFVFFGTNLQDLHAQRTNHKKDKVTKRIPVTTYPGETTKPPPPPKEGEPCPDGEQREIKKTKKGAWRPTGFAFIITGTDEDIDTFDIVKQVDLVLEGNYDGDLSPAITYGQSIISTSFVIYFFFERNITNTTEKWVCVDDKWVLKGTDVKTVKQKDSSFAGPFTWIDINPIRLQKMRQEAIQKMTTNN